MEPILTDKTMGNDDEQMKFNSETFCQLKRYKKCALSMTCTCLYFTYYGFVLKYDFTKAKLLTLIALAICLWFCAVLVRFGSRFLKPNSFFFFIKKNRSNVKSLCLKFFKGNWMHMAISLCYGNYILMIAVGSTKKLICLLGASSSITLTILTCKNPTKIDWKTVNLALAAQTVITSAALRSDVAYKMFEFIYEESFRMVCLYPSRGAALVYGDPSFLLHPIAMYVTSVVMWSICLLALVANILSKMKTFRYFLLKISDISFHTLIWLLCVTSGLISAFTLSFSLILGVQLKHIVNGVAMHIPGSTVIYFISYPKDRMTGQKFVSILKESKKSKQHNMQWNVLGNVAAWTRNGFIIVWMSMSFFLAWVSIYRFLDSTIIWLGSKTGVELSIQVAVGFLLRPMVTLIGIEWTDSMHSAQIIAEKLFGVSNLAIRQVGHSAATGSIQNSSIASLTYACLGFSSFGWYCIVFSVTHILELTDIRRLHFPFLRFLYVIHLSGFYVAAVGAILTPTNLDSDINRNGMQVYGLFIPKYDEIIA